MPERKEQVLDISIQGSVDSSLARAIGVSEAQLAKLKDAVNTINKGFSKKAFAGAAEGFKQTEESANSFHDTMKRIGETMAGVFSAAGDRMPATGWLNTQASAEMGSWIGWDARALLRLLVSYLGGDEHRGSTNARTRTAALGGPISGTTPAGSTPRPGPDGLGELFVSPEIPAWVRQFQTFGIFAVGYLTRP